MIVWTTRDAGEVFERQYAFRFCRKMTDRLTAARIIDVDPESTLGELGSVFEGERDVLFVDDPETIISRVARDMMRKTLERKSGLAVGPVMNVSSQAEQTAELPFRYLDLATFQEACEASAEKHGELSVAAKELDPACVLISARALASVPPGTKIGQITENLDRDLHIATGALVHRFSRYFSSPRTDLANLVPSQAGKVLDIGCAKGGYGRTLKNMRPGIYLVGIELYPELAPHAEQWYDRVITGTIEEIDIVDDFDVINMGDILEHLQNPWDSLAEMHSLLKPGGFLVGSVPNIGHWTIVRSLLEGNFEYIPFGLLCVGHLRFFTEKTLIDSLQDAGFALDILEKEKIPPTPKGIGFIDEMVKSGWGDRISLATNEFVFRARKVSR